jgi:hypothetical protein
MTSGQGLNRQPLKNLLRSGLSSGGSRWVKVAKKVGENLPFFKRPMERILN